MNDVHAVLELLEVGLNIANKSGVRRSVEHEPKEGAVRAMRGRTGSLVLEGGRVGSTVRVEEVRERVKVVTRNDTTHNSLTIRARLLLDKRALASNLLLKVPAVLFAGVKAAVGEASRRRATVELEDVIRPVSQGDGQIGGLTELPYERTRPSLTFTLMSPSATSIPFTR
jgi:hypothetical protein